MNSASSSPTVSCRQVGRPWLHWSERSVSSIWRSNAFISGIKGENHPVTLYRKYGVPMVISTDDAGVTRHSLTQEYVLFASRYKPGYAELKKVSYNSLRYAFLDEAERKRLMRQLDERYAKFEAEIAGLKALGK